MGAPLHRGVWASHCCGLSCCGAWAPDAQAQKLWLTGPVAPQHVRSSQTRAQTHVPCIGRQILNHCATREAPGLYFCSPFPASHSLRTRWRGPRWAEDQAHISAGSWGPKGAGETWPRSLLILCPPSGSPISPSGVGSLPLPQLHLRGTSPVPPPLLLPLHSPHAPHPTRSLGVPPVPLGVHGPPQVPGRYPSCEEMQILHPPSMPS